MAVGSRGRARRAARSGAAAERRADGAAAVRPLRGHSPSSSDVTTTEPSGATISTGMPGDRLEQVALAARPPQLEAHRGRAFGRHRAHRDRAIAPAHLERSDGRPRARGRSRRRRAAARASFTMRARSTRSSCAKLRCLRLGDRAAVIARHVRDRDLLRRRHAQQFGVRMRWNECLWCFS